MSMPVTITINKRRTAWLRRAGGDVRAVTAVRELGSGDANQHDSTYLPKCKTLD